MVTDVEVATALVLIENVALVPPAGTVTLPGTVAAAGMLLDSVTCEPPPGAGPSSVTVPVSEDVPPVTLEALRVSEVRIGMDFVVTLSVAVFVAPP